MTLLLAVAVVTGLCIYLHVLLYHVIITLRLFAAGLLILGTVIALLDESTHANIDDTLNASFTEGSAFSIIKLVI